MQVFDLRHIHRAPVRLHGRAREQSFMQHINSQKFGALSIPWVFSRGDLAPDTIAEGITRGCEDGSQPEFEHDRGGILFDPSSP